MGPARVYGASSTATDVPSPQKLGFFNGSPVARPAAGPMAIASGKFAGCSPFWAVGRVCDSRRWMWLAAGPLGEDGGHALSRAVAESRARRAMERLCG